MATPGSRPGSSPTGSRCSGRWRTWAGGRRAWACRRTRTATTGSPTDVLWTDLAAKAQHADYTVTQLCFDADVVGAFVDEARGRGIRLPVIAGVPGVVDAARLVRISVRIGVADAVRFARSHRGTAGSLLRSRGHRPDDLVEGLAACGSDLAGLHVFTFNQIEPTVRWLTEARRAAA